MAGTGGAPVHSGGGGGGGGLGLMSCVREASPTDVPDSEELHHHHHHEPKKRRFHPLRGLRRMFRRKSRTPEVETIPSDAQSLESRSQSASQLQGENARRKSSSALQTGLSVSHDSIFTPEQRSADSESELESSSSLSIQRLIHAQSGIRAELVDAVRRRRTREDPTSEEEEDLGLPRSPCSNSPTTADVLLEKVLKENTNKSSHSTCSDGSLLSMGSSEMDEDSYGQSSRHSSKLSLQEKRNLVNNDSSPLHGGGLELGVGEMTTAPLSHSAAKHKMAVKPKRTHGVPRRRRLHQIGAGSLPVTPEVNEDSSARSVTPEIQEKLNDAAAHPDGGTILPASTQLKSASLPPGIAPSLTSWSETSPVKLARSRSSAADRQLDAAIIGEGDESSEPPKKEDMSFFGRLLSRRSGKKKKTVVEETSLELPQKRMDEKGRYVQEVAKLSRNHPAARQRVEPINIPSECSVTRMHISYSAPSPPTSPDLKAKDDHIFKPANRVMPLDVDLAFQRRSLVKKSHSFRREDIVPFSSLDAASLPVGLGYDVADNKQSPQKDNENEYNTLSFIDNKIGVLNKNMVDDVTNIALISEAKIESYSSVYIKSSSNSKENLTGDKTVDKPQQRVVSASVVENSEECVTISSPLSVDSLSHQITIPVGPSIVSVNTSPIDDKTEDDLDETAEPSQATVIPHLHEEALIKPEPRQRLPDEVPSFFPVPAPRPSKRDNVTNSVPEFLKVQLNHIDSKPPLNVVLSTNSSNIIQQEHNKKDIKLDDNHMKDDNFLLIKSNESLNDISKNVSVTDINLSSDDCDDEKMNSNSLEEFENKNIEEPEKKQEQVVTVAAETTEHVPKIVSELKQWSSSPVHSSPYVQPVPNPRYSIVSITASRGGVESSPLKKKQDNQIIRKKSIVREANGSFTEKSHSELDKDTGATKTVEKDSSPMKIILRKKSAHKDGEEKSTPASENAVENVIVDEKPPRVIMRQRPVIKDVKIVESQRNSRKSSIEAVEKFHEHNGNGKNNDEEGGLNKERNSFGSSDTLASQDSADIVLRRKSLSREVTKQRDEEPELLKVFARRSLKVKDTEIPTDLEIGSDIPAKSRDSDKENECGDSPPEERKKLKEAFIETKTPLECEVGVKTNSIVKTQRSVSTNSDEITPNVLSSIRKENNQNLYEKRQRSRTFPDNQKILEPPNNQTVSSHRVLTNIYKEKDVEVINLTTTMNNQESTVTNESKEENHVPLFKRIQQRKEEWEKRAQLAAMKRTHP